MLILTDSIPARIAALKTLPMPELRQQWRDLFETDPPPFNRRHLENRIAYRIQELAYGGMKPDTRRRLEILGEQYDSKHAAIIDQNLWDTPGIVCRRRDVSPSLAISSILFFMALIRVVRCAI